MYTVITTVGTSLLTNYVKDTNVPNQARQDVKQFLGKYEKARKEQYDKVREEIEEIKQVVSKWAKNHQNASAEIKSLLQIQRKIEDKKIEDSLQVYLIATDTVLSYLAADIIRESLQHEKIFFHQEINCIKELQVENADEFKSVGMPNLLQTIKDIKKNNNKCILNISGGYKALIPYLTIMGQLFEMDLYYIYEDSNELIEIPVLPFNLDWVFAEKVYEALHSENLAGLDENSDVFKEFSKYSLVKKGNKIELTDLGKIIKEYIQQEYYISRDALGHFMEYKISEYYFKNEYKSHKYIERGVSFGENEFDVILSNLPISGELLGDIIIVEAKLYKRLEQKNKNQNYELEEQIYKEVNILKQKNRKLDEFHLCVFLTSKNQENAIIEQKFDSRFTVIAENIRKSFPNCPFKVFIAKIISNNIADNGRVNYQNIAKMKLDEKTFNLYKEF